MKSIFEQIGGAYTLQGDYRLPNLTFTRRRKNTLSVCGDSADFDI